MASPLALARLHRLIWVLIYGGLLGITTGIATRRTDDGLGLVVLGIGAAMVAGGIVLIVLRSKLKADGAPPAPPPRG